LFTTAVPPEIVDLNALAWPDHEPVAAVRHSDRCYTLVAVSPNHHAVRNRWNLGLSGRWTMCPLSEDYLDGAL
jgi:hypothetical protein